MPNLTIFQFELRLIDGYVSNLIIFQLGTPLKHPIYLLLDRGLGVCEVLLALTLALEPVTIDYAVVSDVAKVISCNPTRTERGEMGLFRDIRGCKETKGLNKS